MSLKAFHVLFILLSIVLSGGFGCWSLGRYSAAREILYLFFTGMSFAGAVLLIIYLIWFLSKMRSVPS